MIVQNKVISILRNHLNLRDKDLSLSKRIKEDLGADSLDVTEISITLENELLLDIPDKSLFYKDFTISDLVDSVEILLKEELHIT